MKSTCSLIKKNKTETNKWRKLIINVHTPQKREKEIVYVCIYLKKLNREVMKVVTLKGHFLVIK